MRFIVAIVAMLFTVAPAYAGNADNGSTTINGGIHIKGGGGDTTNTNTNTFAPTYKPSNYNEQYQGQGQSQYQGQKQGQRQNQNNNQSIAPSQSVQFDDQRQAPAPTAPPLTAAGAGVCLGSISVGATTPFGGLAGGWTKMDAGCHRLRNAAWLNAMGYRDAAIMLMADDPDIAKVLKATGVAIPGHAQAEPAVIVADERKGRE